VSGCRNIGGCRDIEWTQEYWRLQRHGVDAGILSGRNIERMQEY
jgi:hypothetical protein